MPGEINFGALQTPDFFGNALKYQQAGREQAAKQGAANALAAGDYAGAARAYASAGLSDDARQVMADQNTIDRQKTADADKEKLERAKVLIQAAQGLKHVPVGQRKAALQGAYPLFQAAKIDPSVFDGLTEDQLSNQSLDAFSGQVKSHLQGVNLGNGGYGTFDEDTGEFKTIREPSRKPVIVSNGGAAVDAEGNVIYRNPKTFAPPRPRAAAAGAAPVAAPAPWQRKW